MEASCATFALWAPTALVAQLLTALRVVVWAQLRAKVQQAQPSVAAKPALVVPIVM
jgi:hypothetical protein